MRLTTYLTLLFILIAADCAKIPKKWEPFDDIEDLAAVLSGEEKKLYVRAGLEDSVLHGLRAKKVEETGLYEASIKDQAVQFEVVTTKTPYVYTPEVFGAFSDSKFLLAKIYLSAQCGKLHPGFTSNCIATFGPHRAFGNSMMWQVRDWYSCDRGDSLCIEMWKQVGTITYYPDVNCSDTIFVTRKIMRFTCN